jgi:flagellar FliL protein
VAGAKPAPAAEPAEAPAKGGRRKLVLVALAALVLVGGGAGGGAWFFLLRPHPKAEAKADDHAKGPEHVVKVGTIVVNVAGSEGRRYLRATIEVGGSAKAAAHIEHGKAPLVDAAISVLAGKDLALLLDVEKRGGLRDELRERLDKAAHGGVTHVFLTEFVVQ